MATSTRKTHQLLPEIFQTERNKKFLSSTLDQLVEPIQLEKLSGYIGQRYQPSYRSTDVFLDEVTQQRQDYQLEPTVTYKSNGEDIDFAQQYIDIVNQIQAEGGSSAKHNRVFEQEHYAYVPPIDADKFVNYRQYYWLTDSIPAVAVDPSQVGSTTTFGITAETLDAWKFTHKSTNNPDIYVYKGNTYKFKVDAPGQPFWIKTQPGTGTTDRFDSVYVDNNGIDSGTVTLRVPAADSSTTNPNVLYYQCEHHPEMVGRIIIRDLDLDAFDPAENIEGCLGYQDATGFELSSGMRITFSSTVASAYASTTYYVENVGTNIFLVKDSELEITETYTDATLPDYWTINRASADRNAWSRYNRWFHRDVIQTVETKNSISISLTESLRAKRPIIEFLPGLELFNHGLTGRTVDVIDTEQTDAFSQVQGTEGYIADGVTLQTGDTVVFTKDPDQKGKIFTVEFVTLTDSTQLVYLNLTTTLTATEELSISASKGNNKGKTYWYDGADWQLAQQKTQLQQKPLFDVFDTSHRSLSNTIYYPASTFAGSTLFEIATSSQGTPDTVYGTNVIYDRVGLINDIRINDTFNSGTFSYTSGSSTTTKNLRQYHMHVNRTGYTRQTINNWRKLPQTAQQKIIKTYTATKDEQYYEIDQYLTPTQLTDLTVQVFVNGVHTTAYTQTTVGSKKYVKLTTASTEGDIVTVKAYSKTGTPSGQGFFEVALGIQSNPLNENITKLTLGDMIKHYTSATEEITTFSGVAVGSNNLRDFTSPLQYGTKILQHSGSIPLASVFLKDEVLNLPRAMRYAGREYEKFKSQIIEQTNQLSLDGTDEVNLDRILNEINKNKNSSFAFYNSDMLGYGDDKTTLSYTVTDTAVRYYPVTSQFDLQTLSERAIYVYLNNTQLIHGQDYVFTNVNDSSNQVGIEMSATIVVGDVIKIIEHNNTYASYIPATPTKLGLAPKYTPKIYFDTSYQSDDSSQLGIKVIQGHDGSVTVAYNDFRDNILLEFEKRIYNNIKVAYNPDLLTIAPGFFRDNEYTDQEYERFFARDFYTWTGKHSVDYTGNTIFDSGNDFTYNYYRHRDSINQQLLDGHWRAIYKKWFDTDMPHTAPWEMFDFSEKPSWWESRYGAAPYTSGNMILWNDVVDGFIASGSRKGYYSKYARGSNFLSVIPVSDTGDLLAPTNAGIIGSDVVSNSDRSAKWLYGQQGPAETAWRRSSGYRFAEQIAKFLAKPARYAGLYFDFSRYSKNVADQIVYESTYRVTPNEFKLPTGTTLTSGYINTIFDYVKHLGYTASTYVANRLDNLDVQLSYKLGGFTNKSNLQIVIGAVSPTSTNKGVFMPQENYQLLLYKSAPVVTANYSGVIVEKSSGGYKVSGYSNFDRTFTYFPPIENNDNIPIRIGATTDSFTVWQPGGFYVKGAVIKNGATFYRATTNISSGQTFSEDNWATIGNTLPFKGGVTIKKYKNYKKTSALVTYGTEYKTAQEVANFLYGYEKYLEAQGFEFEDYSKELDMPINWDLSAKEFLFWTTQNWSAGAVITLSPAASSLKFVKENTVVDDIVDANQFYTVLQQDGLPINVHNLSTSRQDGSFYVQTNPEEDGIYNVDIKAVQKEHLVVLDNITSFSDVVFNKVLGARQDRIKLVGFRTAGWNGDVYAPGGIIDRAVISDWTANTDYKIGEVVKLQTKTYVVIKNHTSGTTFDAKYFKLKSATPTPDLLPNLDSKAESFRDFYSLDSDNFDATQQAYAQHLIGYQTREYFEDLGLDELTQYKFYQGMIRDKGTSKPISRFRSFEQARQSNTYDIFEEYAFRVGEYGGHRTLKEYEFAIDERKHLQQKQVYQITDTAQADTDVVINVHDDTLLKRPVEFSTTVFPAITYSESNQPQSIFAYPHAGYVQRSQVDAHVFNEQDLLNLDVTQLVEGYTVWIANTTTSDWDVRRFNTLNLNIIDYVQFDNKLQFRCATPHGLSANQYVGITNFGSLADGVYQVNETADSTDSQYNFTVTYSGTVDSSTSRGIIGVFGSVRINSVDDIDTVRPHKGFAIDDYIYVDNSYTTSGGLWKVYQKSQTTEYEYNPLTELSDGVTPQAKYGNSIVVSSDDNYFAVGSPGTNTVHLYKRPIAFDSTTVDNFAQITAITLPYLNDSTVTAGIGNDNFGEKVKATTNNDRVFASAPNSGNLVKLTLTNTALSFEIGEELRQASNGARGVVLDNDPTTDVIVARQTTTTDFTGDSSLLDVHDSSSIVDIVAVEGTEGQDQGLVAVMTRDNDDSAVSYSVTQYITAPNLDRGGLFGYDMSVSGDGTYLVVASPGGPNDSSLQEQGTVYVYKYNTSTTRYDYYQTLTPANQEIGARFGESVDISQDGTTIVVGASQATDSTTLTAGKTYVYRLINSTTWTQTEILVGGQVETDTKFGTSVAVSEDGTDILVGAPNQTVDIANSGAVHHFVNRTKTFNGDGSTTVFTTDFDIDHNQKLSVTVGSTVYVQSDGSTTPNYTTDGTTNQVTLSAAPSAGSTVIIEQYKFERLITPQSINTSVGFGTNIELYNDSVAIYALQGDTKKVTTFDTTASDGSTQLTGTTFDKSATQFVSVVEDTGTVSVYSKYNVSFVYDQTLTLAGPSLGDAFGQSTTFAGTKLYVGAPYNDAVADNRGSVYQFIKAYDDKPWRTIVTQPNLVDVNKVKKVFGYDKTTNQLTTRLQFIDPIKGKLFPEVESNISFKTVFDPADYTAWDEQQVGKVWFDISTIKYQWYEQGDLTHRYQNWAKLHPSCTVSMKEWTRSDVLPTRYNELSATSEGQAQGYTGVASQTYTTQQFFDDTRNTFVDYYYFWVSNATVLPEANALRTMTGAQMASAIDNPTNFTENWSAPIATDSLLVSVRNNLLTDQNFVVHFETTTDTNQLNLHTEYQMVAKGDSNSVIPTVLSNKLHDSLIGKDAQGQAVPDITIPVKMRYGTLNRPRQSWYNDRLSAMKVLTQFINSKLSKKPYVSLYSITTLESEDPAPNILLGGYNQTVDTEVELNYVNTQTFTSGYKILVEADSTVAGKWQIYNWNGATWTVSSTQSYITSNYWSYADWYADGYDSNLQINHTVANEQTRKSTAYETGDIVKVQTSYDGNFRIYFKTYNDWQTIAIQKGTISLDTTLYTGTDAGEEIRKIFEWIKTDLAGDDTLTYNDVFFLAVRLAQIQNRDADWVFKSSFVTIKNTFATLSQDREYQINTSDAVKQFLEEVLPYKTIIREENTLYRNTESFAGDVTDFDNKSYYDFETNTYIAPTVFSDNSTYYPVYNSNPWKFYSDNYKYTIASIIISNPGQGYTSAPVVTISGGGGTGARATSTISDDSVGTITAITLISSGSGYTSTPTVTLTGGGGASVTIQARAYAVLTNSTIRKIDSTIKFDRINSLRETTSNAIVEWQPQKTYTAGQNIRYLNEIYRVTATFTSNDEFTDPVGLSDSSTVDVFNDGSTVSLDSPLVKWSATDRIHAYYSPTAGMAGLIGDGSTVVNAYAQLMTGLEYAGVKILSLPLANGEGYDNGGYDNFAYDNPITDANTPAQDLVDLDQVLDSKTFTTTLGSRAEDINVVGDAFVSEYSAHAPEEVVPGGVYDTLDMKVYTQSSDGASTIEKKVYYGDGTTVQYDAPSIGVQAGLRVFVNNQFKQAGIDYTLTIDANNNYITFTTAPALNSTISLQGIHTSVDELVAKFDRQGDASSTVFNLPVSYDRIQQSYVIVNGVKTSVTLSNGDDSASTDVTFGVAPAADAKIEIFLFNVDPGTKAFSEVVTTTYTEVETDSTEVYVTLTTSPGVIGPYHHKAIVEGIANDSTNRYRLAPPQAVYYTGDGSTAQFAMPNDPVPSASATDANTEVWKNGVLQTSGYTLATSATGKKIVFSSPPADDDTIALVLKSGHDYEIDSSGRLILLSGWTSDSSINNEKIVVTTFTNHDQMGMKTQTFKGNVTGKYNLSLIPVSSSYVFVSVNKEYLTANHDFKVDSNVVTIFGRTFTTSDEIVVTYLNGPISQSAIGYRIFKDILNRYHYRRISYAHSTPLAVDITTTSTSIIVEDGTKLPEPSTSTNKPGVVFIGTERIAYFEKTGNTLTRLFRGTLGTGIQSHSGGTRVVDASNKQEIPYEDTLTTYEASGDGSTVSFDTNIDIDNKNQIIVLVGGTATEDYYVGNGADATDITADTTETTADTTNAGTDIVFTTAPASGVKIRVTKKTGSVWYNQGETTAADGKGLQASTGKEVKFLQAFPTSLDAI